ncbi:DinB family protein [Pseudovibrio exalbescens]|uniref:DinB family protein n=1 Tax=Pseudovibrio exalbescens TaxID=197461 RepID=UPI002365ACDD|nr:DinB family protein [Pseudovibrio exalbescens]MDD7910846.1 DinB family protein [Pseudovibrio exalbescens]
MKEALVARAVYNRNSDIKLVEFIRTLPEDKIAKPRGGCIAGHVQADISLKDLLGHMALGGVFLYQLLHSKGIQADYDQALLKMPVRSMRPSPTMSLDGIIDLLQSFDHALVKFAETIDLSSLDVTDFKPYNEARGPGALGYSAMTWLEHTYSHQIHHRGQISQILSELGVGYDLSQFRIYAFES